MSRPALATVEADKPKTTISTIGPSAGHRSSIKWAGLVRPQLGRLGLIITMLCLLFPIYWLLQSSLSTNLELFHTPAYFFPPHPTFQGYIGAWRLTSVDLLHSLVISAGVVVLDCALAVSAGYGLFLARVRKTATLIRLLVLVGIVFPTITFVIPLDQLLVKLHLLKYLSRSHSRRFPICRSARCAHRLYIHAVHPARTSRGSWHRRRFLGASVVVCGRTDHDSGDRGYGNICFPLSLG